MANTAQQTRSGRSIANKPAVQVPPQFPREFRVPRARQSQQPGAKRDDQSSPGTTCNPERARLHMLDTAEMQHPAIGCLRRGRRRPQSYAAWAALPAADDFGLDRSAAMVLNQLTVASSITAQFSQTPARCVVTADTDSLDRPA